MLVCYIDVNKFFVLCKKKVMKELKCKYFINFFCYVNFDNKLRIKCIEKMMKMIFLCGYKIFISCFKNLEEEECFEKVSIV